LAKSDWALSGKPTHPCTAKKKKERKNTSRNKQGPGGPKRVTPRKMGVGYKIKPGRYYCNSSEKESRLAATNIMKEKLTEWQFAWSHH